MLFILENIFEIFKYLKENGFIKLVHRL